MSWVIIIMIKIDDSDVTPFNNFILFLLQQTVCADKPKTSAELKDKIQIVILELLYEL